MLVWVVLLLVFSQRRSDAATQHRRNKLSRGDDAACVLRHASTCLRRPHPPCPKTKTAGLLHAIFTYMSITCSL